MTKRLRRVTLFLLCALMLFWIERNAALPWLPVELGWPWISLSGAPIWLRAGWDLGLLFLAAALGRVAFRREAPLPGATAALLVLSLWQHTGVVIWMLPASWNTLNLVSVLVFWSVLLSGARRAPVPALLLATLAAPLMTLDRLLIAMGVAAFLVFRLASSDKRGKLGGSL